MEQEPIRGRRPLDAPTPEIARRYLDEAQAVDARRESLIDRRDKTWHELTGDLTLAILVTSYLMAAREVGAAAVQPMIFFFLVAAQISTGAGERGGVRWQDPRGRRRRIVVLSLFAVAMLGSLALLLLSPRAVPVAAYAIPGAVIVLGLALPAAVALSRGPATARPHRSAPLPTSTRVATLCLGLLLAFTAVAIGIPDRGLSAFFSVVILLIFIAWLFAWRSGGGPASMGLLWGPVQHAIFLGSAVLIGGLAVLVAHTDLITPLATVVCAAVVLLAYVGAALRPGSAPERPAS
ncbi:MAG: hypothetical protein J7484_03320 [Microbacterium sp.]|nr:hypothetical protein [Microbacterium sp.]